MRLSQAVQKKARRQRRRSDRWRRAARREEWLRGRSVPSMLNRALDALLVWDTERMRTDIISWDSDFFDEYVRASRWPTRPQEMRA